MVSEQLNALLTTGRNLQHPFRNIRRRVFCVLVLLTSDRSVVTGLVVIRDHQQARSMACHRSWATTGRRKHVNRGDDGTVETPCLAYVFVCLIKR